MQSNGGLTSVGNFMGSLHMDTRSIRRISCAGGGYRFFFGSDCSLAGRTRLEHELHL
jgi:hypothetical protein